MNLIRKAYDVLSNLIGGGSSGIALFGMPTYAGKTVTAETATQVTAIWAASKILAEGVGSLALQVFERAGESVQVVRRHSLYQLLHAEPNEEMSAIDFRMALNFQLGIHGNAFARIARNGAGDPIALWPMATPLMTVERNEQRRLTYRYATNGPSEIYAPRDILHLRTMSKDGVHGVSPILQCRNAVGLAQALEEYGSRFFANGGIPGLVLEYPSKLGDESIKNLRQSWKSLYGGAENSNEVAVLEEGVKATLLGVDPQKAQSIEARKFQILEICRIYRIPPHMLADLDRASFSNIEQQSLEFVMYTLMPWLEIWEQAINRALFAPTERARYFAEFDVEGLLRGDIKSRYDAYAVGRQWGWLSVNDIRRKEKLNPIGPEGDVYLSPLNMVPAGQPGISGAPPPPKPIKDREVLAILAGQAANGHAAVHSYT